MKILEIITEGLGYSTDPEQGKWYHEGRKAFKFGTTGNTIQDIAKKHGCPPEWLKAFHAGYQDQEGWGKGVSESKTQKAKAPKPPNFVAKHAMKTTSGAGQHTNRKRADKQGDVKHKNKQFEQGVAEGSSQTFDMSLAKILKQRGYKGPVKLEQLGMKWVEAIGDIVDIDDYIMIQGKDPEYDGWVSYVFGLGKYAYGAEQGYQTGTAKRVEIDTREPGVSEGRIDEKAKSKAQQKFMGMGESELDEGWKEKLGAAALAGTLAFGAAGNAMARVTPDGQGGYTGGKPVATQMAPAATQAAQPGAEMPGKNLQTVDNIEGNKSSGYTITQDGKSYDVKVVPKGSPTPRGAKMMKVSQAQVGERGIGNYVVYLLNSGTAYLYMGGSVSESMKLIGKPEHVKEDGEGGASPGSTTSAMMNIGASYKNVRAKKQKPGTNALDMKGVNLLTGGSIKR